MPRRSSSHPVARQSRPHVWTSLSAGTHDRRCGLLNGYSGPSPRNSPRPHAGGGEPFRKRRHSLTPYSSPRMSVHGGTEGGVPHPSLLPTSPSSNSNSAVLPRCFPSNRLLLRRGTRCGCPRQVFRPAPAKPYLPSVGRSGSARWRRPRLQGNHGGCPYGFVLPRAHRVTPAAAGGMPPAAAAMSGSGWEMGGWGQGKSSPPPHSHTPILPCNALPRGRRRRDRT
jgi:hypothetical protein